MRSTRNVLTTIIFLFFSIVLCQSAFAKGRVYINVGQAKVKKSLLALPAVQYYGSSLSSSKRKAGAELFNTIKNDLEVSGLFTFIDPNAFLEDVTTVGLRPAPGDPKGFSFSKWNTINTEFLIRGGYDIINGQITFEVYLYYVPQAKLIFGKKYKGETSQVRQLAHTFSNDVLLNVTGKKSMFNSKIVASVDGGPRTYKEIYTMDWDGKNKQQITNHKSIALSPTWSHDGKKVAYTAYIMHAPKGRPKLRNADLFLYDTESKKRWLISYRKGVNSGAAFMKDGKHLLFTISKQGSPDIYKMKTDGSGLRRITNGPNGAMNVEPAISPDGQTVAFSSSRGGKIRLYTMSIHGGRAKLVSSVGKYNATPTWSADGKHIAFAGYDSKKKAFDIFITDKNGYTIKRLTSAKKTSGRWANNEDPTFSPDGRHIMFVSDRTGKKQLYIVSPDGKNERRITYDDLNYSKPKWSPNLD